MRLLLAALLMAGACNRYEMGDCDPRAFQPQPDGASAIAWAPTTDAQLSGRVVDMGGNPIHEAFVDLPEQAHGVPTDDRGEFRFGRRLRPGRWQVRVRAIGYTPAMVSLQFSDGAGARLTATLAPHPPLTNDYVCAIRKKPWWKP